MTTGQASRAYVETTLALQESMPLCRLNLAIVEQPIERLTILLFARLWNQWLRTPANETVFS